MHHNAVMYIFASSNAHAFFRNGKNRNMKSRLNQNVLSLLIVLLSCWQLQAQYSISGRVLDASSGAPLPFAEVLVHDLSDALITGASTEVDGSFTLSIDPDSYRISIRFLGYDPWTKEITVQGDLPLGELYVAQSDKLLEEIEVVGEKSELNLQIDKRVFNVGKDLIGRGGTALNVLDNVPSVTVDVEGNVELRGKSDVKILIDGKPSALLDGSNMNGLNSIQSSSIDRIEVITNPSSKYEAGGTSGIINIILKKDAKKGFNGSVNGGMSYPLGYFIGLNLNYRKSKFNWFLDYSVSDRDSEGGGTAELNFYDQPNNIALTRQTTDRDRHAFQNSFRFGADYFITAKQQLTLSAMFNYSKDDNLNTVIYNDYNAADEALFITRRIEDEHEREPVQEYNLHYTYTFKEDKQALDLDALYTSNDEQENSDFTENQYDAELNLQSVLLQRARIDEGVNRLQFSADYADKRETHEWEFGGLVRDRNVKNNYGVDNYADNKWNINNAYTNEFHYSEGIYAAYGSWSKKYPTWSYKVGMRWEYTNLTTELLNINEVNTQRYSSFFPSANIAWPINEYNKVQLSYARRIQRPGFFMLNPFITFADSRQVFGGNPKLQPEFANQLELNHSIKSDFGSILHALYYKRETQVITRINVQTDSLNLKIVPENVGLRDNLGYELTFSREIFDWWRLNASGNLFWYYFRGAYEDQTFDNKDITLLARLSSNFKITKGLNLQVDYNFRGPMEGPQGKRRSMNIINMALSQELFKRKATITLNVSDLLNSRKYRGTLDAPGFHKESTFQWRKRTFNLDLVYRINAQPKAKGGGRPAGNAGEGF